MLSTLTRCQNGTMETFGQRLRKIRHAHGMSQVALAESAGMDRSHVIKIETGRIMHPEPETVFRLARALGISTVELVPPEHVQQPGTDVESDELVSLYSVLTDDDRVRLVAIARALYQLSRE
jgi:transcriptional regulator with XRE-family HTH domain